MKGHSAAALGALLVGVVHPVAANGVVQWDIRRSQRSQEFTKLRRRGSTFNEVISNDEARGGYFATCQIGTPGQNLTLQLDTGSSDIWVPDSKASVCRKFVDSAQSSSFEVVGKGEFDISYVDGSSSKGDYFTDVFSIGGATLQNMTMGLGLETDISYGLVGVGYAVNEAIVGSSQSVSSAYPNLPVNMVNEGLINTVAYSLWLNDLDASSGSILFGGIDTKKYKGDLTRIQIYPATQDIFTSFKVALTSLEAISPSGQDTLTSTAFPIAVVLDSGTTLSYLPTDLAMQIWKEAGAEYSAHYGTAIIPCSMQNSQGYFSFGFAGPGGPRINVTMDELVLDVSTDGGPQFTSGQYKGETICEFGIQNISSSPYLLGDTFLRSAYVVYDLVNNEVGIAQTDFNSTESNVVAFASMSATIPSATVAPSQAEVTNRPTVTVPAYAASKGFTDLSASGTAASTSAEQNAATPTPSRASTGQMLVVSLTMLLTAVGSGLFVAIL
ncbi:1741a2b6-8dd7-4e65-998f-5ba5d78b271f [Thermothielavioides terrestris]|uniref:1741a2b6-8dd7-4e65-998f-5ba5d78b271f n=1 Tax=Thermothielavioides terrestris TaxID=2587410 RepID=A0A446B7B5_9PEZI|nr:1741a2b6-8dd7-4e65-998f-5ba5d78b271f [Thermothielavioides terrestris]